MKDGGGRTVYTPPQDPAEIVQLMSGLGRFLNVLYLVKEGLLDTPVLHLSNHIVRTKADYYRLLQSVRAEDHWEDWVLYMLQAVETTARQTIGTVQAIKVALMDDKHRVGRSNDDVNAALNDILLRRTGSDRADGSGG
jgi:Fic family protein